MYKYETHLHTAPVSACGHNTPAEQVQAYKARGYAGIIITDHFVNGNCGVDRGLGWKEQMDFFLSGYREAKKAGEACGLDVFLGWEYNLRGTEFLTYGLDEAFLYNHPDLATLPIAPYSALVRQHGGYLAQAHPYRAAQWVQNPHPVDAALMDGIEVFNASQPQEVNQQAYDFAVAHGVPMQAGTDAHSVDLTYNKNICSGVGLSQRAQSIHDIIAAIKAGDVVLLTQPQGSPA